MHTLAPRTAGEFSPTKRIATVWAAIADWISATADYYAAAEIYKQLSRLSDVELRRRGLSRATLAQNVFAACDTSKR
jgi:hypothetical protein